MPGNNRITSLSPFASQIGGSDNPKRHESTGCLNVRQRIEALLDKGTVHETENLTISYERRRCICSSNLSFTYYYENNGHNILWSAF